MKLKWVLLRVIMFVSYDCGGIIILGRLLIGKGLICLKNVNKRGRVLINALLYKYISSYFF